LHNIFVPHFKTFGISFMNDFVIKNFPREFFIKNLSNS
jgi:hypothetical protein